MKMSRKLNLKTLKHQLNNSYNFNAGTYFFFNDKILGRFYNMEVEDLSYKAELNSDVKCFHVYENSKKEKMFRVYYFYNMNGLLNTEINLELHFKWDKETKDVEMVFENGHLKVKEQFLVSMLSEKAKEHIRADILNLLEYFMENGDLNSLGRSIFFI